jgi:riboflavin transporter FmnP
LWTALLIVSFLKLNFSFIPIVILALVFNATNVIGFTYADRDAKQRWANSAVSSGWSMGLGGVGGQIVTGMMKNSVAKVFS